MNDADPTLDNCTGNITSIKQKEKKGAYMQQNREEEEREREREIKGQPQVLCATV